jgi:hypothetical protein
MPGRDDVDARNWIPQQDGLPTLDDASRPRDDEVSQLADKARGLARVSGQRVGKPWQPRMSCAYLLRTANHALRTSNHSFRVTNLSLRGLEGGVAWLPKARACEDPARRRARPCSRPEFRRLLSCSCVRSAGLCPQMNSAITPWPTSSWIIDARRAWTLSLLNAGELTSLEVDHPGVGRRSADSSVPLLHRTKKTKESSLVTKESKPSENLE